MRKITLSLHLHLFLGLSAFSAPREFVHHPQPREPTLIAKDFINVLRKEIPKPPEAGTEAQRKDESELRAYEKSRTEADCAAAKAEVMVSLGSFYGGEGGILSPTETRRLRDFFSKIRNDADYFIQLAKKDFPRPRPFTYLKDLKPCVPKEVSLAYPSGHATLSQLFAKILVDIYPERKEALLKRSQVIADHRILAGMHHRSDVVSGQKLGDMIYAELQKSSTYKKELATFKK